MTPPAHQVLIIEPKSVGKQSQKDEATVGSQLTFKRQETKAKTLPDGFFLHLPSPARKRCVVTGPGVPLGVEVSDP